MKLELSRGEAIGLVSILMALPSFGSYFITGRILVGVLTALLILIVVSVALLLWSRDRKPEYTINRADLHLTFEDKRGRLARLEQTKAFTVNHKGPTEFWIRGIAADGAVQNIKIDGRPLSSGDQVVRAGLMDICKRYRNRLERGETRTVKILMEAREAFMDEKEYLVYKVTYPTEELHMKITLPEGRVCTSAEAYEMYHGQAHHSLSKPSVNDTRSEVTLSVNDLELGAEYYVEWKW